MSFRISALILTLLQFAPDTGCAREVPGGQCVMYGECGVGHKTSYMRPCAKVTYPQVLKNKDNIKGMQEFCPDLKIDENTKLCCDDAQAATFRKDMGKFGELVRHCPSCFINIMQTFCRLNCAPNQSTFMKVTDSSKHGQEGAAVEELTYYVTKSYADRMFASCKDVRISGLPVRYADAVCHRYGRNCDGPLLLKYAGKRNPSPFLIDFQFSDGDPVQDGGATYYPMNATTTPCSEPVSPGGKACRCSDCGRSCRYLAPSRRSQHP